MWIDEVHVQMYVLKGFKVLFHVNVESLLHRISLALPPLRREKGSGDTQYTFPFQRNMHK